MLLEEKYEALKLSASQSGAQIEDDVLFLEAVGGVNRKGTVYGLGSESEAYCERPTSFCKSHIYPLCTFPNGSPLEKIGGRAS